MTPKVWHSSDGTEHQWDAATGKWLSTRPGGGTVPRLRPGTRPASSADPALMLTPMWARDRFTCHCRPPESAKFLCNDLVRHLDLCIDGERAMRTISKSTVGQAMLIQMPLTGQILVPSQATVVPHYAIENQYIESITCEQLPDLQIFLNRGDGLIRFLRVLRDSVESWSQTQKALANLMEGKVPGCTAPSHSKRHDIAIVKTIRTLATYRLGEEAAAEAITEWNSDTLLPVLREVALTEGYSLGVDLKCFACQSEVISRDSIPDDLIPTV